MRDHATINESPALAVNAMVNGPSLCGCLLPADLSHWRVCMGSFQEVQLGDFLDIIAMRHHQHTCQDLTPVTTVITCVPVVKNSIFLLEVVVECR